MTFVGILTGHDIAPLAVECPSSDQLRRGLEIAIAEGDAERADLCRRHLLARGEDVPEPRELAEASEPAQGEYPRQPSMARPRSGATATMNGRDPAPTRAPQPVGAKARCNDPASSHRAAALALPRAGTCKARLLDAIAAAPNGLTAHAASEASGVTYVTASTRLTELVRDGFIARTGETRETANGGSADILVIAASAAEAIGRTVAA